MTVFGSQTESLVHATDENKLQMQRYDGLADREAIQQVRPDSLLISRMLLAFDIPLPRAWTGTSVRKKS
jgi:hypothetical protein